MRFLFLLLFLVLYSSPSFAQGTGPKIFDTGDCLTGGPVGPAYGMPKTIMGWNTVNTQTGTTYTVVGSDHCKLIEFTNAGAVAVSLPAAGGAGFAVGWMAFFQSDGAGGITITPAAGTIQGASSLVIPGNGAVIVFAKATNNYRIWYPVALPTCTQYQMIRWGASGFQCEDAPYDFYTDMAGVPLASAFIRFAISRPFKNLSGLPNAQCSAKTAATASTTVTFTQNGSSIGTFVWGASATTCTITFSSNITWAISDIWELDYPGTADATLADISITVPGVRQ